MFPGIEFKKVDCNSLYNWYGVHFMVVCSDPYWTDRVVKVPRDETDVIARLYKSVYPARYNSIG